jgi:predicted nucleic acid-binding protein
MIVLDTNVLSEALRSSPSAAVLSWLADQNPREVFITAITQAEVLHGVEVLPAGKRRTRLHAVIEELLLKEFEGRILSFDEEAARAFAKIVSGREAMGRPISQFDAMIAAISRARRAVLATRNIGDFEHCGVRLVSPWDE